MLGACDPGDDRATAPTDPEPVATGAVRPSEGPGVPATPGLPSATLPPVDQFTFPRGADDVVVQVSIGVPVGPSVPLLTVYGSGRVIAGTDEGWRTGEVSEFAIQRLLDDAESVGLLDEPLVQRRADVLTSVEADGSEDPDIAVRLAVDGRVLLHELDLLRIERPPGIRAFVSEVTVENRFGLTDIFEPEAWIVCSTNECDVVETATDSSSRPVLPHERASALLTP